MSSPRLTSNGSFASPRQINGRTEHPWDPPPEDPLSADALDALMVRSRQKVPATRFCVKDIICDPKMATAALRELDETQLECVRTSHNGHGSSGGYSNGKGQDAHFDSSNRVVGVHDVEIERQQAASDAINSSVLEEGKINREMADLLVERLDGGLK